MEKLKRKKQLKNYLLSKNSNLIKACYMEDSMAKFKRTFSEKVSTLRFRDDPANIKLNSNKASS